MILSYISHCVLLFSFSTMCLRFIPVNTCPTRLVLLRLYNDLQCVSTTFHPVTLPVTDTDWHLLLATNKAVINIFIHVPSRTYTRISLVYMPRHRTGEYQVWISNLHILCQLLPQVQLTLSLKGAMHLQD